MPSNSFFDWASSLVRFIPRDTARAEDVNDALDEVSSGFTDVEALTNAAIKLSAGETSAALGNAASRLGKVLSFNAATGAAETVITATDIADAQTNADAAAASAAAAAASYDSFDDRYLGAKAVAPTLDNDGNALVDGALYFNTVTEEMNVWSSGAWVAVYLPAASYALDADLISHTGSAAAHGATGAVVGTTNAQTLTNKTIVAANNTITTAASGNLAATNLNAALAELQGDIDTRAPKASPTFTGVPAAPTAAAGTNTTQLATTAFVKAADDLKAELAGSASQSFSMLNGTVAGLLYLGNGNPNIQGAGSDIHVSNGASFSAGWTYTATGLAVANYYQSGGEHVWRTAAAGTAGAAVAYTERMRIANSGAVTIPGTLSLTGAASTLGYGVGAGGTVTQATSRTTGVTLNKATGAITLVSAAGSTTIASFTVTNSLVAATDAVVVNQVSGTDLYEIHVTAIAAGSFRISFKTTGGTTTEQPVFRFELLKGASA